MCSGDRPAFPLPLCCSRLSRRPASPCSHACDLKHAASSLLSSAPPRRLTRLLSKRIPFRSQINPLAICFGFGVPRWYFSLVSARIGSTVRESAVCIKGGAERVSALNEQCVVLAVTAGLVRGWGVRRKTDCLQIASESRSI